MDLVNEDNEDDEAWGMVVPKTVASSIVLDLLEIWQNDDDVAVYRFLSVQAAPRLISHLKMTFSLQEADCQDCLSVAFDNFQPAVRSRKCLSNPYGYFFKIGVNAALELLRERKAELLDPLAKVEETFTDDYMDTLQVLDESGCNSDLPSHFALAIVEDAVSELEIEEFWAVEVVRTAVERLSPSLRKVVHLLMFKDFAFEQGGGDFNYLAQQADSDLGMKAGAFRTAKHRAYVAIREMVPALIIELGLDPPERAEAAIFPNGRGRFLDDDEEP